MKSLLAALAIFISFDASAAAAFRYDQRLAMDLARAYLNAFNRQHPDENGYASENHALVSSAIAARNRHLVFVTFAGTSGSGGFYVALEFCKETNLLTVADVGAVDNIQAYRDEATHVNLKTYVASPAVCPAEIP
ncbi:hypothetical protein B0E46_04630 [Rhodanobacter sp. B04]|uniref:hypothetical protein n=1 Tax=Rhodanobacter sp. B04 TaxID=1945860 RepID=UPI000984BD7D|nr:hypothetical protein [Rhodanobacter sp. B04]OOG65625.1 hypothetical protein B0E46_04630 [Rhodanobacter sp. B04]